MRIHLLGRKRPATWMLVIWGLNAVFQFAIAENAVAEGRTWWGVAGFAVAALFAVAIVGDIVRRMRGRSE
jgi:membrane protein YdbS with pleckstrin-like domain